MTGNDEGGKRQVRRDVDEYTKPLTQHHECYASLRSGVRKLSLQKKKKKLNQPNQNLNQITPKLVL